MTYYRMLAFFEPSPGATRYGCRQYLVRVDGFESLLVAEQKLRAHLEVKAPRFGVKAPGRCVLVRACEQLDPITADGPGWWVTPEEFQGWADQPEGAGLQVKVAKGAP
ncbi:MAG: hypothetical protein RLZZ524_471 [Pseudomonadota bacterium]|jgi:hypothetical protein